METRRVHPYPPREQLFECAAHETPGGIRVFVIPGVSIMERQWLSPYEFVVRCPGCGASQRYSRAAAPGAFVHADDDCPIRRRIEAALARARARCSAAEAAEAN